MLYNKVVFSVIYNMLGTLELNVVFFSIYITVICNKNDIFNDYQLKVRLNVVGLDQSFEVFI